MTCRVLEREPKVNIELEWTRPTNTYGELLGYKLRYGIRGQEMFEIMMTENKRRITDLGIYPITWRFVRSTYSLRLTIR